MYNSAMTTGDTPATRLEDALQRVKIRAVVARRMTLEMSFWRLDIVSPFWRIYVQKRSGAYLLHEGRRYELDEGRLHVLPAWLRFQTGLEREVEQDFIHFYLYGIPPSLQRRIFDRPLSFPIAGALAPLVAAWREGLVEARGEFSLAEYCWTSALAQAAMAMAFSAAPGTGGWDFYRAFSEASRISPALSRIEEGLDSPPSNRELAALCGASEDHFIRLFRDRVGSTPAQYCLDRRLDAAAEMLTDTGLSIKEIAEATGFSDRFHFSKVIKERLGLPPAQYRRLHGSRGSS
jgi:AraC-like DNA-binding protein